MLAFGCQPAEPEYRDTGFVEVDVLPATAAATGITSLGRAEAFGATAPATDVDFKCARAAPPTGAAAGLPGTLITGGRPLGDVPRTLAVAVVPAPAVFVHTRLRPLLLDSGALSLLRKAGILAGRGDRLASGWG